MRSHVLDLGDCRENRALDLLGDVVRPFELEIARELQVERDLDATVHLEDDQVVDLAHLRNTQGRRQSTLTDLRIRAPRLHVHDDVGVGKPLAHRVLDRSAAAWPWPTAAPGAIPMTTSAKCPPPDSRTRSRLSSTGGSSASIEARAASSASTGV